MSIGRASRADRIWLVAVGLEGYSGRPKARKNKGHSMVYELVIITKLCGPSKSPNI